MKCPCHFSGRVNAMEIGIFRVVSKTFAGKLFARNAAFREMERQCADRIIKTDYPLKVGFQADLTSKV